MRAHKRSTVVVVVVERRVSYGNCCLRRRRFVFAVEDGRKHGLFRNWLAARTRLYPYLFLCARERPSSNWALFFFHFHLRQVQVRGISLFICNNTRTP